MSLQNIREQIKVILSGVDGIGVVHDHFRFSNMDTKFTELFKDADGRINGCMFSLDKNAKRYGMGRRVEKARVFVIRRFTGFQDGSDSEINFDNVNELIGDAFDTDDAATLNGSCDNIDPDFGPMSGVSGLQMEISEPRWFSNMLCHYAELRLCAVEIID
ncbi:MAG: hypothetical protein LLG40_11170 [Deltaproteobacteria bacterium]|nr:hypothetical protein [Deltaproteobacteria bacterium]